MYKIIHSIPAHEGPIKTLSAQCCIDGMVASGGQDSTVRQWLFDGSTLCESFSPLYHSHWISAISHLNPNCHPSYPNVTCSDTIVTI